MSTKLITAADRMPVSVESARRYLRALEDEIDLVSICVKAAVSAVEDYTGRCLVTRTFCQQMDRWPDTARERCYFTGVLRPVVPDVRYIELERTPLATVTSLKYYPSDLTAQVAISPVDYSADVAAVPGRVTLLDGYDLPTLAVRFDAIELTYVCGYGLLESVMPDILKIAIFQLARHCYDNPAAVDGGKLMEMPLSYKHLLRGQKVGL